MSTQFDLRSHQRQLKTFLEERTGNEPFKVLAWVVPGGGKSHLPVLLAQRFPRAKVLWFVPRLALQRQAAASAQQHGIVFRESGNDVDPCKSAQGCIVTHQSLCSNPDLWVHEIRRGERIVVIDEPHHAKQNKDGSYEATAAAVNKLACAGPRAWMDMTGTLDTNDNSFIYGMTYEQTASGYAINPDDSADHIIRYTRANALAEGALVPMEFLFHDGPVQWAKDGRIENPQRLSDVSKEDEGAAIFTALRTGVADALFLKGVDHWKKHRRGKLLIVTYRQDDAKKYASQLKKDGISTGLAIDDNDDALDDIETFKCSGQALVTCQMAYEGLDVPACSHVVCLTWIRSVPWIEQMFGRVWRASEGKRVCFAFVPDDPRMRVVIQKIKAEQPAEITVGTGPGGPGPGDTTVVPLSGLIDAIRRESLDGFPFCPDAVDRIEQLLEELGITSTPELINQLIVKSLELDTKVELRQETYKDKEMRIRRELNRRNSQHDYQQGWEPGETNKKIWMLYKKSVREMTLEELVRATDYANKSYPVR